MRDIDIRPCLPSRPVTARPVSPLSEGHTPC